MKVVVISVKKPSSAGGAEVVWYNLKKARFKFENISLDEKDLPFWIKLIPKLSPIKEIMASKWLLKKAEKYIKTVLSEDFKVPKFKNPYEEKGVSKKIVEVLK